MLSRLRTWGRRVLPAVTPLGGRTRWALLAVLGIGAVLRLVWVLGVADRPTGLSDPGLYLVLADMVADGDGYNYPNFDAGTIEPTAYYPPGYSMTLGAVIALAQLLPGAVSSFGVAVGLNVVLSVATIAVIFELGRRLVNPTVGLVAAALFAVWPNLVVYNGVVLTETLFLFVFVTMLLVALATPEVTLAPGRRRLLVVGLLFGYAVMIRPTALVVLLAFPLLWWPPSWTRRGVTRALGLTGLVAVGLLALAVPWSIRNAVQMDSLVFISTNQGDNLCIGNHPEANGAFDLDLDECVLENTGQRPEAETTRQSENVDRALSYLGDHPDKLLTRIPAKLRYTLDRDTDGLWAASNYNTDTPPLSAGRMDLAEALSNGFYVVVGLAGLAGAVLLWWRPDDGGRSRFLVLACAIQLVPPALTFGDARFKLPIYPALALGAATAAAAALSKLRQKAPEDGAYGRSFERATPTAATSRAGSSQ